MAAQGYESASLGIWGWICTLQAVIGLLCYVLSSYLSSAVEAASLEPGMVSLVAASTFTALASVAIVSAFIIFICAALSYFMIPRLSSVLLSLAGLLTLATSLAAAILMGRIVTEAYAFQLPRLDFQVDPVGTPPPTDYTVVFVSQRKASVVGIGTAALVSVALTTRALVMRSTATALDSVLFSACLAVAAAISASVTLQKGNLPSVLTFGILWTVGTVLLLVMLQQQKICWPRFTSIVLALLSGVLALLGIVTVFINVRKFTDVQTSLLLLSKDESKILLSKTQIRELGGSYLGYDYLVLSVLGVAATLSFVASTLASFRSVLGPSPAEKEMAQESAEEALEGRS